MAPCSLFPGPHSHSFASPKTVRKSDKCVLFLKTHRSGVEPQSPTYMVMLVRETTPCLSRVFTTPAQTCYVFAATNIKPSTGNSRHQRDRSGGGARWEKRCHEAWAIFLKSPPLFSLQFCSTEERFRDFVSDIQSNARRYISIFSEAADDLMPESTFSVAEEDSFDVLMRQARHSLFQT